MRPLIDAAVELIRAPELAAGPTPLSSPSCLLAQQALLTSASRIALHRAITSAVAHWHGV